MKWLLLLLVVGGHSESFSTEPFADRSSCVNAGREIKEWVENNDARIGSPVRFTCVQVSGK